MPTANIEALFQYTTSRNHKVISQAVDIVASMQTAPACTRMAASHLMNECKQLDHAPDFAKSRPELYLDNVKTEYAAKLAICELLSAQPLSNALPPHHCDILVPSIQACNKGRWWPQSQISPGKQCYPEYREQQYNQCLKTLQSSPQYWTSFSNARQNAVVMCQASRDAIERENHLEMFMNLTQVMGVVSSNIQHTTDQYASLLREQKRYADELRESQSHIGKDLVTMQEEAMATVTNLDDKFRSFMKSSISELIAALSDSQSAELVRIRNEMQVFSQDMITENHQLSKSLTSELQQHHDRAIKSLAINHAAQVDSYWVLSRYMDDANDKANSSLGMIDAINYRLGNLLSTAELFEKVLDFTSDLSQLLVSLICRLIAAVGALFILGLLYHFSSRLATYTAGAGSAAYFLHFCGVYEFLASVPAHVSEPHPRSSFSDPFVGLSATQKGVGMVMVLWLATYPVSCISTTINNAFVRILSPYWVRQYNNGRGIGLLPSVEIPRAPMCRKVEVLEKCIAND